MTAALLASRDALMQMQQALEDQLLDQVREFERATGMCIRAIKVYPGDHANGRALTRAVEVSAQLR